MKIWRMAFRVGTGGYELWRECLRLGIAAIAYRPMVGIDLSRFPKGQPKDKWKQLASAQQSSLKKVAYEMEPGDTIYVKQGKHIVGRGSVTSSYQFDSQRRLLDPNGTPWEHQVRVEWHQLQPVKVQLGSQQVFTVQELSDGDVRRFEQAFIHQYGGNEQ